jgi:thiamine biosynthesis lipoprotein
MKSLRSVLGMLLALPILLSACAGTPTSPWETASKDPTVREKTVQALGTRFIVRLWIDPKDRRAPESLFKPAIAEILRVARITDADDSKSEIARINKFAATRSVQISPDLNSILVISQKLHDRTGGIFDVTFAPIQDKVESFGPDAGLDGSDREFTPSGVDKETRQKIGGANWVFDAKKGQIKFAKAGIKLVVKGLAKGYAAQKAAEKLLPLKIKGFAIIAGNSFVASGAALKDPQLMCIEEFGHPGHCQYSIKPLHPEKLFSIGMAASSDRPGHNYNPKSGSRTYRSGGAAVCGADGAWTQGAATAASILDESKFYEFFKNPAAPPISGLWAGESSDSGPQGTLEPYAQTAPVAE